MTAESTGSGAALFLAADGAVLKNIRVSGTAKGQRQRGRDRGAGEEHAVPWLRE